MSNTVANASTPAVNAVSPTTTADKPVIESELPELPKKGPKFASKFDETIYELNKKYGGSEDPEFKSLAQITDEVQARAPENANKLKPKQQNVPARSGQESKDLTQPPPELLSPEPQLKRYKVEGKIVELTPEQADRMVQKGLYLDKKNSDIATTQRQLDGAIQNFQQAQERFTQDVNQFLQNPAEFYEQKFGAEKARQVFEPYVGRHVVKEIEYEKNPIQRQIDEANYRAQIAEQQLQQERQARNQFQVEQQANGLRQEYQNIIVQALEMTQNLHMKNDMTAGAMAHWMKRGLDRNIQYTPQQLVRLVKDDYATCTKATTSQIAEALVNAYNSNDAEGVNKLGAEMEFLLGQKVVSAIGKYLVNKVRNNQPKAPPKTLEVVRNQTPATEAKRAYMKPDEVEAKRRRIITALERGENVPENVWEIQW